MGLLMPPHRSCVIACFFTEGWARFTIFIHLTGRKSSPAVSVISNWHCSNIRRDKAQLYANVAKCTKWCDLRSCDLDVLGPELLLGRARLSLSRMCSRNFCSTHPLHFWHFSIRNICMPVECVSHSVSVTAFSCDHTSDECSSSMTGSETEAAGRETEAVRTWGREEEDWHRGGAVPGRETQSGHRESKTPAVLSDRPRQGLHVSAYDILL